MFVCLHKPPPIEVAPQGVSPKLRSREIKLYISTISTISSLIGTICSISLIFTQ